MKTSTAQPITQSGPIKIGVSACLVGQEVRYNGSHKRSRYIDDILSQHFELMPLCPEVGIGMSIPRPPIHLITTDTEPGIYNNIEAVLVKDHSVSFTKELKEYAKNQAEKLIDASGYIFMHKSPSCGYQPVKLYHKNGMPLDKTQGIYAAEIERLLPLMPKEDAGRINDPQIRENFLSRVMAYSDWQKNVKANLTKKSLTDFHVRYKYKLMSHHIHSYQELGRIVSNLKAKPLADIAHDYITMFMQALKHMANRNKHTNVLQHLQGYLKKDLSTESKHELGEVFTQYRKGYVPLIVPLTLLNHHVQTHTDSEHYLQQQKYLKPHPFELSLLNAI